MIYQDVDNLLPFYFIGMINSLLGYMMIYNFDKPEKKEGFKDL
jgi:hypothetical protein